MDRQLRERLIGAGVLVLLLVVVVPWILDGRTSDQTDSDANLNPVEPPSVKEPRRTHTIRLDQSTERPPVAQEVSEPSVPPASTAGRAIAVETPTARKSVAVEPKPAVEPPAPVAAPVAQQPAKATPVKPKPAKPKPKPTEGWVVQLGSFSSKPNAQRLADEVSARGFPAFMMPLQRSGKILYRVRVGPRKTREQATDLAGRLAKVGYSGQVTRQQPDA